MNKTYGDTLTQLNSDVWVKLNLAERLNILQSIENEMAIQQRRKPCQVKGSALPSHYFGKVMGEYAKNSHTIYINYNQLGNNTKYGKEPELHLETVLHEGRHAYQVQVVNGDIKHHNAQEVKQWKNNLKEGHYISYRENPLAYYNQPVETDARIFARSMKKLILTEKDTLTKGLTCEAGTKNYFTQQMAAKGGFKNTRLRQAKTAFLNNQEDKALPQNSQGNLRIMKADNERSRQ